jgi:LysR family transcriptional regulator, carnitine catabolism transcriptional activator
MNLTHRQFEVLIAAADAESFSAAAQRLGISQPSLSESIRRIEGEIGARLFERTTRSMKLTPEGHHAAAVAREIVRDFKRALDRLASPINDRQGRISIAALPSIACAVLPAVIEVFRREHPGIDVTVHDIQHERALAMVIEGTADIAVTLKPAAHNDLVFTEIGSDIAYLVCRADDALAQQKSVRWRDLSGRPFIGFTHISSVRRITDAAFVHAEIAIEPRYQVEQIPTAIGLVEAGLGVTALPSLTFSMFKGRKLAVRPLVQPRLRRNVGLVTFAGRTMPGSTDALLRAIRHELLQKLRNQSHRA